jgi:hypothetical protein
VDWKRLLHWTPFEEPVGDMEERVARFCTLARSSDPSHQLLVESLMREMVSWQGLYHWELVVRILQVVQLVGSPRLLNDVRRMAANSGRSEAGRRVRAAALECLPALQQRAAREEEEARRAKEAKTLLRPSHVPAMQRTPWKKGEICSLSCFLGRLP